MCLYHHVIFLLIPAVDITNDKEVNALAATATELFESIDVVVNNAGRSTSQCILTATR